MAKKAHGSRGLGLNSVTHLVTQSEDSLPYTIVKNGKYYFSKRAPLGVAPNSKITLLGRLVTVGKNGYVRFPLGVLSKKEVKPVALQFAAALDRMGLEAQKTDLESRDVQAPCRPHEYLPDDPVFQPTTEDIQSSAEALYAFLMDADEVAYERQVRGALGDRAPSPSNIPGVLVPFQKARPPRDRAELLEIPPPSAEGDAQLIRELFPLFSLFLHMQSEKMLVKPDVRLLPMVRSYRRYVADLKVRAAAGEVPTPPMPAPTKKAKGEKTKQVAGGWDWNDAFNYYIELRTLKPKSIENYSASWKMLQTFAKVPLEALSVEHVVDWRDAMQKSVHVITAKNRLVQVAAIWRENQLNAKIPRDLQNPFAGLTVRVPASHESKRTQFSEAELKQIFTAPPCKVGRTVSELAGYWIPLIGLYHGARLQEICGLEAADIEDSPYGLTIHIRPNGIRGIKGNAKGARHFPVHPKLLELGFADYVKAMREAGVSRVFPGLSRSETFGDAFTHHVRKLLNVSTDRLVGMHCFRHNWETAKRDAIPNFDFSIGAYLLGRRIDQGSAAVYGTSAGLKKLKIEIAKIDYALEHLSAPDVSPQVLLAEERGRVANMAASEQRKNARLKRAERASRLTREKRR